MPFITQGKTNWKFLVIVIILAIIVGGGAFLYARRPEKPYQPVEVKKSATADWKTYRNEDYWYEIKYPEDWVLDISGSPEVVSFTNPSFPLTGVRVSMDPNTFSSLEEVENFFKTHIFLEVEKTREININSLKGYDVIGSKPELDKKLRFVEISLKDKTFEISCVTSEALYDDQAAIFDKIINSFSLIGKTYKNDEVGIELKYPSDWKDMIFEKRTNAIDNWPGVVFLANDQQNIFYLSVFSKDYRPFESVIFNKESVNVDWSLAEFISNMSLTGNILFVKKLSPKSILVAVYDAPECSPYLRLSVLTPLNNKNYPNLEISISFPFDKDPTIKEYGTSQAAKGLDPCDELEPYRMIADKIYYNTYSDMLNSYIKTARIIADSVSQ